METFTVYILYSESADKYYIGQTADLEQRLQQHNDPFVDTRRSKYTLKIGPGKLVYSVLNFGSRSAAMKREKEVNPPRSLLI